jgi:6-phosphogluconolactonase/glucosamine-6-phosphate isomerase/deaminase
MSHISQPAPVEVMVADNPAEALGAAISDLFERSSGNEILFLVAGGSSLAVLEYIVDDNISSQMTVAVTDERVSDDLDINNYAQLQATSFWNKLVANDAYSIPTELLGRNSKELSDAFDAALRKWREDFPKGLVVGLYGIGEDGHTAGILPGVYSNADFDSRYQGARYVEEFESVGKGAFPFRVTTTLSFMRDVVDVGYFFVRGETKAKALKATLSAEGSVYETPARIVHEMKKAFVFTDIL